MRVTDLSLTPATTRWLKDEISLHSTYPRQMGKWEAFMMYDYNNVDAALFPI